MVSNLFFLLRDIENDLLLQFVGNSTARHFFGYILPVVMLIEADHEGNLQPWL